MNTTTPCRICGDKAMIVCACGVPACGSHSNYYFDDANIAITRSARGRCEFCAPPKYPRPFSLVRALERGEWELAS